MNLIFLAKRIVKKLLFVLDGHPFIEFNSFPVNNNSVLSSEAVNDLAKCCGLAEELALNYRLADGTILGIYRDGRLIPHDNDIDIDVLVTPEFDEDKVYSTFINNGFRLGRKAYFEKRIQQMTFYNKKTNDIFDMIFWYQTGKYVVNYSERNFERSQEMRYFEGMTTIHFNGRNYPAPAYLEEWLVMRYGIDWNIPKTFKSDWKEECFDLKKKKI